MTRDRERERERPSSVKIITKPLDDIDYHRSQSMI